MVKKDVGLGGTAENQQMKPEKTLPPDHTSRACQAKLKEKAKVSGNLEERIADAAAARKREAAERAGDVLPIEIPCTPQILVTKRRTAGDATRVARSEMQQRVIADDVLDTRTGAQRAAILVMYLDREVAKGLLRQLDDDDVRAVGLRPHGLGECNAAAGHRGGGAHCKAWVWVHALAHKHEPPERDSVPV